MADDPVINPSPYVDAANVALLEQLAALTGGKQVTDLSLADQREVFDVAQTPAPPHPDVEISNFYVDTTHGKVKTFLFRPKNKTNDLPFFYHVHGGGWILANAFDFTAFICDLVTRTGYAAVFPEYTLAPERQFPAQQEQCLEVLQYVLNHGSEHKLLANQVVITCDSAGGQLGPAISILNHQRNLNLPITHQILICPIIDTSELYGTFSQWQYQNGPFLARAFIQESIDDYIPNISDRTSITASPLLMTQDEVKKYMPPTTILTAQADSLRDQGQNFAKLLQQSGVECGVLQAVASLHDFVVLDKSRVSPTAELIMTVIAGKITQVLSQVGSGSESAGKSVLFGGKEVTSKHMGLFVGRPKETLPLEKANGVH